MIYRIDHENGYCETIDLKLATKYTQLLKKQKIQYVANVYQKEDIVDEI